MMDPVSVVETEGHKAPSEFRLGYRPVLDGVRAIAILGVLGVHVHLPFVWGGGYGVDLFFVLSGCLISILLLQEWDVYGRINIKKFYLRRTFRLMPPLFVLLTVYTIVQIVLSRSGRWLIEGLLAIIFYVANWYEIYNPLGALQHTWSLAVEEQFYLIWPALLCLFLKLWGKKKGMIVGLSMGIVLLCVTRAWLWMNGASHGRLWLGTDTRGDALLAGCIAGIVLQWNIISHKYEKRIKVMAWLSATTIILMLMLFHPRYIDWLYAGGWTAMNLVMALFIFCVLHQPPPMMRMVLESRPLVWIGKLSYSLYLWHNLVNYAVDEWHLPRFSISVKFVLSFIAAMLSYYFIERFGARLKERLMVNAIFRRPQVMRS
jgi:peptidoglycan/LPS O-acetylase OafA/YrhL